MLKVLFGFHGRLRRTAYFLWGLLFIVLPYLVGSAVALVLIMSRYSDGALSMEIDPNTPTEIAALAVASLGIFVLPSWIFFALSVKRLHDLAQSGLFSLLVLVPGIGAPLIFVVLSVAPGTKGENRYGADPRA